MEGFVSFILEHAGDDPARLLLSRSRWKDIDLDLAVSTIQARKRLEKKLPAWHSVPSLIYPLPLAAEQCSSQETALYKAALAFRLMSHTDPAGNASTNPPFAPLTPSLPLSVGDSCSSLHRAPPILTMGGQGSLEASPCRIADLTGGMGADSWAFATKGAEVLYNEASEELAKAAKYNFKELGIKNIRVQNKTIEKGNAACILGDFVPDLIYLDPARRGSGGKRVFALEDCSPDLTAIKDELLGCSRFVMAKISPMADISLTVRKLGPHVREIHVVSSEGECKELLVILDRDFSGEPEIYAWQNGKELSFKMEEERTAQAVYPDADRLGSYRFLFRPSPSLTKAGLFNLPCSRFGLVKLARDTHLYFCDSPIPALEGLGRFHLISEMLEMSGKAIRETGKRYPKAEVTAKNIGMDGEGLRKKLGSASGGDAHIFGVTVDPAGAKSKKYLIIA